MSRHPLAEWLDAGDAPLSGGAPAGSDPAEPGTRRRRWRLIALATLPWAVLGGVLIGAGGTTADRDETSEGDVAAVTANPSATSTATSTTTPAAAPDPESSSASGAGRQTPARSTDPNDPTDPPDPPAALAAAAAVAVRAHISDTGGPTWRHVDLALPEGGEPAGPGWVVRVLAVVLEGDAEGWDRSHVRRFAVAIADDGVLLEAPWPLAPPEDRTSGGAPDHGPEWEPLSPSPDSAAPDSAASDRATPDGVEVDAVSRVLSTAGFAAQDLTLARSSEDPTLLRATFEDEDDLRDVWLTTEPDLRLLGEPTDPPARP